jgi:hypothetical protein
MSAAADLSAAAMHFVRAAGDRLTHTVDLAASEARLAVMTGVTMLVLALLTVAFVLVGWGFLIAALAQLGVAAGFSWAAIALVVSAVHFIAALGLLGSAMRLSHHLTMPALRRALAARATPAA